jgi:hypothetical protein
MDALSRLDLVFCVDLTSSMHPFIQAARSHMVNILDALRAELGDGLRVAIVGYRDHCDGKRLLDVNEFTSSSADTKKTLDKLEVLGGGDYPEAVFTGLDACLDLYARSAREGAYRVTVLVGDAPPHACGGAGDTHPSRDPSGYTIDDIANRLEEAGVFVHALSMRARDEVLERAWKRFAISTGGTYHDAQGGAAAMKIVETIAHRFLRDIEFDRKLYAALDHGALPKPPVTEDGDFPSPAEDLAKKLRLPLDEVQGGIMRLRQRRLLRD